MPSNTRKPVIAGNWKMYKTIAETEAFFAAIVAGPNLFIAGEFS